MGELRGGRSLPLTAGAVVAWSCGALWLIMVFSVINTTLAMGATLVPDVIIAVCGVLYCVGGYGLWQSRRWAGVLCIAVSGFLLASMAGWPVFKIQMPPFGGLFIGLKMLLISLTMVGWKRLA